MDVAVVPGDMVFAVVLRGGRAQARGFAEAGPSAGARGPGKRGRGGGAAAGAAGLSCCHAYDPIARRANGIAKAMMVCPRGPALAGVALTHLEGTAKV